MNRMEARLKRNVALLYAFSFCWLALVIIPVIVPFFASKGLSLADVFVLQAIFAASMVLFEVPSGYLADLAGRKNALVLGSVFHGVGFTLLYFVDGFVGLAIFEIILGLGMSLMSGADLSLLYDSQRALGMSALDKSRGIANMGFIKGTAEGVAALLGGLLVLHSFDAVVVANALVAWFPLALALFLVEAPYRQEDGEGSAPARISFRRIWLHLFHQGRLLRLTTLALTFYGLATFYVVWLLQPYWESYGVPLTVFGLLWALKNFTVAIAARASISLEQKFGPAPVLIAIGALPVLGYVGMAAGGGLAGMLLAFCFYVSRGLHQVILTDAFNARVPSEFRATANSLANFLFRFMFIWTGPIVGLLYDGFGMSATLWILAALSLALFLALMLPLLAALPAPPKPAATPHPLPD